MTYTHKYFSTSIPLLIAIGTRGDAKGNAVACRQGCVLQHAQPLTTHYSPITKC
jgi:hypothetical protein